MMKMILFSVFAAVLGYAVRALVEKRRRLTKEPRTGEASFEQARAQWDEFISSFVSARAPDPFGHAHCRAALATLVAAMTHVHKRLAATSYSLDATDAKALAWLLEALAPLQEAIVGDPRWGATATKHHLHDLDGKLAPGSWWRKSQKLESAAYGSRPIEVPVLEDVYDAAFAEHAAKRLQRKRARVRNQAGANSGATVTYWAVGGAPSVALSRGQREPANPEGDF